MSLHSLYSKIQELYKKSFETESAETSMIYSYFLEDIDGLISETESRISQLREEGKNSKKGWDCKFEIADELEFVLEKKEGDVE